MSWVPMGACVLGGIFMFLYGYLGPHFPEIIAHRGFGIERLCTALYLTTNGVFGVMANVLATYVILFIFFGAFLHKSGAGKFFIDFPLALAGRSTGGPAKVAVIASAFFGSALAGSAFLGSAFSGFTSGVLGVSFFGSALAGSAGQLRIGLFPGEFADPDYLRNPANRCYFCKKELFDRLREVAEKEGMQVILDGSNSSDRGDHRPGLGQRGGGDQRDRGCRDLRRRRP